ncbi:conserved hypothetical protein [delta proteobacterium NaphS2]|nr:conserved hypothetical protein [delta proteobacterium NaphS2]
MAETCRKCRWSRVDTGDPTKGACIAEKREGAVGDTASGTASVIMKGKLIKLSDEACELFEPKPSHAQLIREGI